MGPSQDGTQPDWWDQVRVGPSLTGGTESGWDGTKLVGPNPHGVRGTLPTRSFSFLLLQIFMIFVAINRTNTDTPPTYITIFSEEFSPGSLLKAGRMSIVCDLSNFKLQLSVSIIITILYHYSLSPFLSPFSSASLSSSLGSLYLMVGLS